MENERYGFKYQIRSISKIEIDGTAILKSTAFEYASKIDDAIMPNSRIK